MKKALYVIVILIYTTVGLYFGSGSIVRVDLQQKLDLFDRQKDSLQKISLGKNVVNYYGYPCNNQYDLKVAIVLKDLESYPIIQKANNVQATMIAASSFGLIGSIISLTLLVVFQHKTLAELSVWSVPFLGTLTGLVVVALIYLLPTLLVKGEGEARPYSLMFIALFSGIYNKEFYQFLHRTFITKILKNEKDH